MIDEHLLQQAVERQQQRRRGDAVVTWVGACLVFTVLAFVLATVGRVPVPRRYWVALLGGVIGGGFTIGGVRVVQRVAQSGMRSLLEPGGTGRERAVYSHAEALASQGNQQAAARAFEAARAEHGVQAILLRAEADLAVRADGHAERARELLLRLRRAPDATRADELYATHRLIDLYLGPLADRGRAMVELRRLADRYPGTPDAAGALTELERLRALLKDEHERS
ncbi:MAG: hypothetical protein ACK5U0_06325 [Gemmatimonas sp.]|jgi:hypothetical protein|uniref:hypothetical protein n=1 Tax=Gemmatimonas sp. TaxID=1962908 RepID=UPI00391B93D3|nr:hypothetical protein [Gemmatimonadota bacterium]